MKLSPLDELGMAITNAGYTWTPEMRKAYERGVREQEKEWAGLTDEELSLAIADAWGRRVTRYYQYEAFYKDVDAKLKEKKGG